MISNDADLIKDGYRDGVGVRHAARTETCSLDALILAAAAIQAEIAAALG